MVLHKGLQLVRSAGGLTVGFVIEILASGRITEASANSFGTACLVGSLAIDWTGLCFALRTVIHHLLLCACKNFRSSSVTPLFFPSHLRSPA